jgi:anaerobic selenocysteine-containing dehydrogenase
MAVRLTRRQFIKATGATAATVALSKYVFDWPLPSVLTGVEAQESLTEELIPTTCWIGKQDCGMIARVVDGRIVKFEGHPDHPRNRGTLCVKGQAQIMSIYDPYRVKAPLRRTNAKGVPGEWTEISWDEAIGLVGDQVKDVIARNPKLLLWQKGRSKAKDFYDDAFVKAAGCEKLGHGAYCSDAAYRACEYTYGMHGGIHPDFRHCNYLISMGWGLTSSGGNKTCWLTWPQQFLEARERGMKHVTLDPWRRGVGPHTDEWLPIKPVTDLAFWLAIISVLIDKGFIDQDYLTKHTNAPSLVKNDGYFLMVDDKEQVWDTNTGSAQPFDAEGISPALEGAYTVDGASVKTSFQVLKEHVAQYTPEWAAEICDLPVDAIRRVGQELGENARIGSTIVIDGVEVPYRPVGLMAYHSSQQETGFQSYRAANMAFMLLGAFEAAGSMRIDFTRGLYKNWANLDNITIKDPPYNIYLKDSKYFPINTGHPGIAALATINPEKYGVEVVPEVMIIHMTNPLLSFLDQEVLMQAYAKYKFIAVIDPFMTETADYFADVVLPAATIEKYEGPLNVTDQYNDAKSLRLPPMAPLYQSRSEIDIYLDLCERAGILFGDGGYISVVNKELKLDDANKLDLNTKPVVKDIFERWARSAGYSEGVSYFEQHGITPVKPIEASKYYASVNDPPYYGARHRLYGVALKRYHDIMQEKGAGEIYRQDYTALPTWRQPTMNQSPSQYDLTLISHKRIEFKQSRTTHNALLNELRPEQRVIMNTKTAEARGINDDDWVVVESHNAVTSETRTVRAKAKLLQGIRPDTVSMSHHYGFWVHPWAKDKGPTPNALFFTGEGYTVNTADQAFQVRVKVTKELGGE